MVGPTFSPAGSTLSRSMRAAVSRHPQLGRVLYVDRGWLGVQAPLLWALALAVGLVVALWAADAWSHSAVVAAATAVMVLLGAMIWGLVQTRLLVCQGGLVLCHPWPARWHHLALPWAALDLTSLRPVSRLDRLPAMTDRRGWAFPDSHPTGRGIVFIGPLRPFGVTVAPLSVQRRLWWYASRRDPVELAQALAAAGAGSVPPLPVGPTVELSGRPQDAALQLPPLPPL